jgi:hypothetical protein
VCLPPGHAAVSTGVSQLALIYTLLRLLPPWPGVPEPPLSGVFSLRVAVLRTGVLGVCVIGILAGFGTVAFPYSVLRAFVVPVNPYEVKALQTQLGVIREQARLPDLSCAYCAQSYCAYCARPYCGAASAHPCRECARVP